MDRATAAPSGEAASSGGLIFYFSVAPSELIKGPSHLGEQPVRHGSPQAAHAHHVFVAIFDAASTARITDAAVTAKASGIASASQQKRIEPITIADAIAFGALFNLHPDLYTITVTVQRPGFAARVGRLYVRSPPTLIADSAEMAVPVASRFIPLVRKV